MKDLFVLRQHGFSSSSHCSGTPQQATGNQGDSLGLAGNRVPRSVTGPFQPNHSQRVALGTLQDGIGGRLIRRILIKDEILRPARWALQHP